MDDPKTREQESRDTLASLPPPEAPGFPGVTPVMRIIDGAEVWLHPAVAAAVDAMPPERVNPPNENENPAETAADADAADGGANGRAPGDGACARIEMGHASDVRSVDAPEHGMLPATATAAGEQARLNVLCQTLIAETAKGAKLKADFEAREPEYRAAAERHFKQARIVRDLMTEIRNLTAKQCGENGY